MMNVKRWVTLTCLLALAGGTGCVLSIPDVLEARFVIGEPVWRELPVRDSLQGEYDRVWQTVLNTILEHNFDIATMEKSSGYLRTTWNASIVSLEDQWFYRVQISIKLVDQPADTPDAPHKVMKVRLQVNGEVSQVTRKGQTAFFRVSCSVRGLS
jgi:hypothetical protein